jgi:hypothetical protein
MALAYDAARVTRDVDAMFVPHRIVHDEAMESPTTSGCPGGGSACCMIRCRRCTLILSEVSDSLPPDGSISSNWRYQALIVTVFTGPSESTSGPALRCCSDRGSWSR